MRVQIAARKKDVKTLSLDIIKRNGLSVKFKTKLYHKGYNDLPEFYHQEYIYNQNKQMSINMNLNLNSFIQFNISNNDDNYKEVLIMTEVSRNKFIRKTAKLVGLIEAYESEDIDLLKVDSSGTHILSCFQNESKAEVKINKKIFYLQTIIREDVGDIGILLSIDEKEVVLCVYDFLDLVYKLRSINFIETALNLITYFGSPDLGENATDFREDVPIRYDAENEIILNGGGRSSTNNFNGLKSNNTNNNNKTNNKINW